VEVVVVEADEQLAPGLIHHAEVDEPAGARVDQAAHLDLDLVAVTVDARALVPGRHVRQAGRGLEAVLLGELDDHTAKITRVTIPDALALFSPFQALDRRVWILTVARVIVTFGFSLVMPFLAFHLAQQRAAPAVAVGLIWTVASGAGAAA